MPLAERAVLLKALLVHSASWRGSEDFIRPIIDPASALHHEHWRREVSRHLGYGFVDPEDAIACASDRATMWATGTLAPEHRSHSMFRLQALGCKCESKRVASNARVVHTDPVGISLSCRQAQNCIASASFSASRWSGDNNGSTIQQPIREWNHRASQMARRARRLLCRPEL